MLLPSLVVWASSLPGAQPQAAFDCTGNARRSIPNLCACALSPKLRAAVRRGDVQVLFAHLPKAGGTTAEAFFDDYLRKASGRKPRRFALPRPRDVDRWYALKPEQRTSTRLLVSKASAQLDDAARVDARGLPRLMATTLRDPVERILSHFRYIQPAAHARLVEWGLGVPLSRRARPGGCTVRGLNVTDLGAFARWYRAHRTHLIDVSNLAVRLLVTRRENSAHALASQSESYWDDPKCMPTALPLPAVSSSDLAHAQRRLARMALVGLVHDMGTVLRVWRAALGMGAAEHAPPPPAPARNASGPTGKSGSGKSGWMCGESQSNDCTGATGARAALEREWPALVRQIEADNRFDMQLWAYASSLYELQLRACNDRLRRPKQQHSASLDNAPTRLPRQPTPTARGPLADRLRPRRKQQPGSGTR